MRPEDPSFLIILKFIEFRVSIWGEWVYPFIYNRRHPKVQVRAYFNIIKKDGSYSFKKELRCLYLEPDEGCVGKYMNIEELLDEDNGYLDEGALTIEYGLQVLAEEGEIGIWFFNFFDVLFNWQSQNNMFDFMHQCNRSFFGHKQIVQLHSKKISNKDWIRVPKSLPFLDLVICLQISHGVRLEMTAGETEVIAKTAFRFGFSNTVRFCEQKLIEMGEQPKLKTRNFKMAVKFNMEHYLKHLMKEVKSPERLMSILKRLNIEKMSSESMKTFVAKYLDLID